MADDTASIRDETTPPTLSPAEILARASRQVEDEDPEGYYIPSNRRRGTVTYKLPFSLFDDRMADDTPVRDEITPPTLSPAEILARASRPIEDEDIDDDVYYIPPNRHPGKVTRILPPNFFEDRTEAPSVSARNDPGAFGSPA